MPGSVDVIISNCVNSILSQEEDVLSFDSIAYRRIRKSTPAQRDDVVGLDPAGTQDVQQAEREIPVEDLHEI